MKKALSITIILLVAITAIGGSILINGISPKAPPINGLTAETITSITVTRSDDIFAKVEETDFEEFLENICSAKPTRKQSVNDRPYAESFYIIDIETSERSYRYFVYKKNSQVYLELPYQGIYKADQQFWNFVDTYGGTYHE